MKQPQESSKKNFGKSLQEGVSLAHSKNKQEIKSIGGQVIINATDHDWIAEEKEDPKKR